CLHFPVDIARGLAAIAEMKRRLATQPPITAGGDRVSSSATASRQAQPRRVEATSEGQGPEIHVVEEDSPANSSAKKLPKSVVQDDAGASIPPSFRHVLAKGFHASEFVDKNFMDEDTRAVLAKIPLEDTLPGFKRCSCVL
ncbi:hypothetical protein HN51_062848, partial [Arachis hypogaea]